MYAKLSTSKAAVALSLAGMGAGLLMFAAPAFAGVGVGVTPNFPSSVKVGDTGVTASIGITNNSSQGDGNPLTLSSIKLIPSCGAISAGSCTSNDAGVFSVSASATGAGSCAADTFTTAVTNVTTGEVTFTPSASIALTPGQTCTINFTINVLKVPTVDATGASGIQTLQLANVAGTDQLEQPGTGSGSDTTTVAPAAPSISTTPSAGGPVGTMLNDTATLTGGSSPTGSVTFNLYPPSDASCSGAPAYTQADATAPYGTSPGFASNAAGVWHWTASYAGDANNVATSSSCTAEPVTITQATPTIATTLSTSTAVLTGSQVHDSAVLTGATSNAGGTATYTVYSNNACTLNAQDAGTVAVTNGSVADSNAVTFNSAGTYYWQVVYHGDTNNAAATSTCGSEVLTVVVPQGHIIVDKVTTPSGDPQSFNFTTIGTGYNNFSLTDQAAPNDQTLIAGEYSVTESATPGWVFTGASCSINGGTGGPYTPGSTLTLTPGGTIECVFNNTKIASPTITTMLSTTTPVLVGSSVSDSATLSGASATAGGTATYSVYTDASCSAGKMDAGTVTVTNGAVPNSNAIPFNAAGTYYWQVVYHGDTYNAPATSTCGSEVITVVAPAGQYCSPGYWKQQQHFDSWVGYSQTQSFSSVFGRTITIMWSSKGKPMPVVSPTLLQALEANGGGTSMLARVAVDALLNASALTSGFTTAQVISIVQQAYDTNNYSLLNQLTIPENCPLN